MQNENVPTPPGHFRNSDGTFSRIKTAFDRYKEKHGIDEKKSELEETAEEMIKLSWPEKPLTHHQQAVKEFMMVLLKNCLSDYDTLEGVKALAKEQGKEVPDFLAGRASVYADAYIKQIKG